jgi:hypothetical protein
MTGSGLERKKRFLAAAAQIGIAILLAVSPADSATNRYTVILADPPTAERFPSGEKMLSEEARVYRDTLEAKQKNMRAELAKRHIEVTGSITTVQNALFVKATPRQAEELKKMPGVKDVVPQRRFQPR